MKSAAAVLGLLALAVAGADAAVKSVLLIRCGDASSLVSEQDCVAENQILVLQSSDNLMFTATNNSKKCGVSWCMQTLLQRQPPTV
jgi:hypothetical protein